MNSFGIVDLLLVLGISQGIFLAITLSLIHNKNKRANKILSFVLFIASLMLVGRICYPRFSGALFFRIAGFVDTLIFVFGPLFYIYIRRLTFSESPDYKIPWYHFIPAFLHIAFFIWTLSFTIEELKIFVGQGGLDYVYFIVETTGLISNLVYMITSYHLLRVYKKVEKENLSYSQKVHTFLKFFLFGILMFLILWMISYANYFMRIKELYFISYHLIWMSIPIFIYIVGFFSLKQPEIFRVPLIKKKAVQKGRLNGEELEILKKNLEDLMVHKKIYLNNELTLKDLSKELNTSTNNVSWLLNNIHKCSFYDYINTYRVQEFISKIQKGEHFNHTILALSLDSGFNSKSTFNKAFKMIKNDTPSNYIKKMGIV
ncbi:AraC family transcriptional regulator [uncultured Aquimarina sp.]|uniref:helix-turn-helix domain-containing protein n=1 Tax=uncultured Aquimarina sp. TaxID=575652 RepID=UPI00260D6395|nr:helix-turn-helix domain-containing protein [uncultured Aquimarina sp.]